MQRLRNLRHRALPQGRQARLHADQQGRPRPHPARALRSRDRQGGARRVRPDEARGLRSGDLRRVDRRARRNFVRGRAHPPLLPGQGLGGGLQAAAGEVPGQGDRLRLLDRRRPGGADHGQRRHRSRRALHLRPQDQEADAAVQGARADPARADGERCRPCATRPRTGSRSRPTSRCPRASPPKNLPAILLPARRPVGARQLGLQQPRAVPGQPRLRGAAAELPRLDGLRQEVPERRQQAVGRQDAGRRHLGRQVPRRPGHRRPEARRDHGRLLRRLRDARRRGLHARRLRRRRRDRGAVEPDHAARLDPALLGGRPHHLLRADGQSEDARGQGPARAPVAAQLRAARSRRRCSSRRAPTTRASRRPSRSRS